MNGRAVKITVFVVLMVGLAIGTYIFVKKELDNNLLIITEQDKADLSTIQIQ